MTDESPNSPHSCGEGCGHREDVPEASPEELAEVEDLLEGLKPQKEGE